MSEGGVSKLEQVDDTGQRCSSLGQEVARQGAGWACGACMKCGTGVMEKDSLKRWHNICLWYVFLTAWGGA